MTDRIEPRFIGLDIETTGSTFGVHKIIQFGIFDKEKQRQYVADIGWAEYEWTQEALDVNGFTHERIKAGPPASTIDYSLSNYLDEQCYQPKSLVPIGWNVGSFDMPFVREALPESAKFFSYRSVDLNSVCFTIAQATGESWRGLKSASKRYVETVFTPRWHDAGDDAKAATYSWEYFLTILRKGQP